jgi:hypothetical protein
MRFLGRLMDIQENIVLECSTDLGMNYSSVIGFDEFQMYYFSLFERVEERMTKDTDEESSPTLSIIKIVNDKKMTSNAKRNSRLTPPPPRMSEGRGAHHNISGGGNMSIPQADNRDNLEHTIGTEDSRDDNFKKGNGMGATKRPMGKNPLSCCKRNNGGSKCAIM